MSEKSDRVRMSDILVYFGEDGPSLFTGNCEENEQSKLDQLAEHEPRIVAHRDWVGGKWVRKGYLVPEPRPGEVWKCNANVYSDGSFVVALPDSMYRPSRS